MLAADKLYKIAQRECSTACGTCTEGHAAKLPWSLLISVFKNLMRSAIFQFRLLACERVDA